MAKSEPIVTYVQGDTGPGAQAAKDALFQTLAAHVKPNQDILASVAPGHPANANGKKEALDFRAEDPRFRVFGKEQYKNDQQRAAQLMIKIAPTEWKQFKTAQFADQAGVKSNEPLSSIRGIGKDLWAAATFKGSDLHQAAKVGLLVKEGVLKQGDPINADIANNVDSLLQKMPQLKALMQQKKMTPEKLAEDVGGALKMAEAVDLNHSVADQAEGVSQHEEETHTVREKMAMDHAGVKRDNAMEAKLETTAAKESVKDRLKSSRADKVDAGTVGVKVPTGAKLS